MDTTKKFENNRTTYRKIWVKFIISDFTQNKSVYFKLGTMKILCIWVIEYAKSFTGYPKKIRLAEVLCWNKWISGVLIWSRNVWLPSSFESRNYASMKGKLIFSNVYIRGTVQSHLSEEDWILEKEASVNWFNSSPFFQSKYIMSIWSSGKSST